MTLIRADLTKKADFSHRLDKEHQLSALEVDPHSFDWVWSSSFATWLKGNDNLFWIAGKLASGIARLSTICQHTKAHISSLQEGLVNVSRSQSSSSTFVVEMGSRTISKVSDGRYFARY
jgi:cob(I)alamin adenosyltransferase